MSEENKIIPFGIKDKIGYMFGDLGNDFTFMLASNYLMIFYTNVLGISGAAVGTLFLVARIVDAFTDMSMGRIVDVMKPAKDGRFKPWLRRICIPVALAGFLMYQYKAAGLSMGTKYVYMYVTYLLWGSFFYTAINIPYGSMASVISSDPADRSALSTFRSVGSAIAGILLGVVVPFFIYQSDAAGNQVVIPQRFTIVAGICSVLAVLCYIICYRFCQERVQKEEKPVKEKGSLARVAGNLLKNQALLAIIGAALLLLLSVLLAGSMNNYLFKDYFKNIPALSLAGFLQTGCILLVAPFATKISQKFGKKESGAVAMLSSAIVYLLLFFLKLDNAWVFCILVALGNLGSGYFNVIIWAYITDIIDYQEVHTKSREDGTIYAVYSFARKIGQALAGGISGFALSAIGYVSSSSGEQIQQSADVVEKIYAIATIIPAVCYFGVAMILFFWYPLSKKIVLENTKVLSERRPK